MKNFKKVLVLAILLTAVVGCGKIPTLKDGEQAVATIDKGGISAETLYNAIKDKYGIEVFIDLLDEEIFNNMFEETDDEKEYVNKQIDDIKDNAKEQGIEFTYLLQANGYKSEKELKEYIKLDYRRNLAVNNYLQDEIKDKEINKYYEDNVFGDIKVSHILISPDTTDDMTEDEKTEALNKAKKEAEDIIAKLKKGEKFADLAKKYSDDSSNASKGGDLGWISTGDMVEEFDAAAFALKKGTYTTSPVKTTYGYHVIYKEDEKDKPKLDDVKDKVLSELVSEKLSKDATLYYSTLEKIRENAGLKFEDKDLKSSYNTYMKNLKNQASSQS